MDFEVSGIRLETHCAGVVEELDTNRSSSSLVPMNRNSYGAGTGYEWSRDSSSESVARMILS